MPRGIAILYSSLSKIDLFNILEEMLNKKQIYIEYPNTNLVQVCNSDGELYKINKERVFSLIDDENSVITFWGWDYDSILLAIHRENEKLNSCTIYLDGLDIKMSFDILSALKSTLENEKIKGFVFDRREMSEGVNWLELFGGNLAVDNFIKQNKFDIIFEKVIAEKEIFDFNSFNIDNIYVAVKKLNDISKIYEIT